jgi:hypothetical protein
MSDKFKPCEEEWMRIIGIDPGKHGSLALIETDGSEFNIVDCQNMPEDEQCLVDLLIEWCAQAEHVFIEAIPKFAGENRSAAFMAVLYGNYKFVCGAVRMHRGPKLHELGPVLWMNAAIPAKERSRDRTERKRQLLELTKQTWPNRKWTLQKADAPLIGKYGFLRSTT